MLRSYDVFDTVLTRLVGLPTSLFLFVGQYAVLHRHWAGTADQFAAARVAAEGRARANAEGRETTLAAIYAELQFAYALGSEHADAVARAELELESKVLRAVPGAADALARERDVGHSVAFLSDMYLPATVVRDWLYEHGLANDSDRIWVSSESGDTKSTGRLFERVAKHYAIESGRWTHTGDNLWSDSHVPRSRGIAAVPFVDCQLTPLEEVMERHSAETAGLGSLFAGAARWTRLSTTKKTERHAVLNHYASQVAGPAIYAFVLWVLQTAQREGVRRIWFMARDGEVMLPVARTIARRLDIDVDVGYLYAGRQVVKVAALRALDDTAIKWITGGAGILSVADVLARVGVESEPLQEAIDACGLPARGAIGWEGMANLATFLRHPDVTSRILAVAAERRDDVLAYFRQCGLIGDERCCVVDIGWRGTVVKAIDELVGRPITQPHLYLYFGLYSRPPECAGLQMTGYLFDLDGESKRGIGSDIGALTATMETFCQADHGQVMRLRKTAGGFEPVCRPEAPAVEDAWDVGFFQQRVAEFAENVVVELCPQAGLDPRSLVAELLRYALDHPTADQAKVLGGVMFIDDQAGSAPQPLAHRYGISDLRSAFQQGGRPWYGLNWWSPGAWALTSRSMRVAIRAAAKLGKWRRRFGRSRH